MIYEYQLPVYRRLFFAAKAFEMARDADTEVRCANHRLILGPSGFGKTWTTTDLAIKLDWPSIIIKINTWEILGGSTAATWNSLAAWVASFDSAFLVILEGLDQLAGSEKRSVCSEIISLLDGVLPPDSAVRADAYGPISRRFRSNCMVWATAALPLAFDSVETPGFNPQPRLSDVSKWFQPELLQRFDSQFLIFPTLSENDYRKMMLQVESQLPAEFLMAGFRRAAERAIPQAVRDRAGARFIEQVLVAFYEEAAEGLFFDEVPS